MESDPAAAADALLPEPVLRALRPHAGDVLERTVTLSGRFAVSHRHDAGGNSEFEPSLTTTAGDLRLFTNGRFPDVRPGSSVTVSGFQLGTSVLAYAPGAGAAAPMTVTASAGGTPLGQLDVAVILANFSNSSTSLDPAVASNALVGSPGADVASWYAEASYGRSSINPSVFGPYAIASTSSGTCPNLATPTSQLLAAASPDLTYAQFRRLVLIFNCTGYGASTGVGEGQVSTPQGPITGALIHMDATLMGDRQTYAHELAHNVGNYHAASLVCQPSAFVPPTRFGEGCASAEYGDEFDTLGATLQSPRATPHLGPHHKDNAGWFVPGNLQTLTTPGTHTYLLAPYETDTGGVLALDIPRGSSGTSFTLEYRQPSGFDAWMAPSNTAYCGGKCTVTQGPTLRLVHSQGGSGGGSDTQAIDTTPASIPTNTFYPIADNRDGALLAGRTFTDPEYGISVTTLSADATGATVQVTIPEAAGCTRQAPTVTLQSPSTQSVPAGQAATYSLSIRSNDSPACPGQLFRYAGGQLMGVTGTGTTGTFTALSSPDELTLGPGASATMAVTLVPDATVTTGSYGFSLTSSGGIGSVLANSLNVAVAHLPNVTLSVVAPADTSAPSSPANLTAQNLGATTVGLGWSPAADNVATAGYRVVRSDGSLFVTASPSLTDTTMPAGSTRTYSVQAFDRQGNLSAAAAATVTTPAKTDLTAPSTPGGVTGSATDRAISLDWAPSKDNVAVVGYLVSPFGRWFPAGTTAATFANLPTNTTYAVRVEAVDGSGNRSPLTGGALSITTARAGMVAPTQPDLLRSPQATQSTGIEVAWSASTAPGGVAGYHVYRNSRRWATVTDPSFVDPMTDLYPGAGYQFFVVAFDHAGNLSPATPFVQTVAPRLGSSDTSAPTGTALASPGPGDTVSGTVTLSAAPADDVGVTTVEFYVDGTYAGQDSSSPFTLGWNTMSTFDGTHTLYARAYDAAGNYGTASVTSVRVANDVTPPSVPTGLTATAPSSSQVALSWTAAADDTAMAAYTVTRDGADVATVSGTSFTDTAVTAGASYTYRVLALDVAGNTSAPSAPATVTVPQAAPVPTTGAVGGVVTRQSTGAPLSGAKVVASRNGVKTTVTTSASGGYSLPDLAAGSYSVTYSAKGVRSQTRTVQVTAGQTTTVHVAL
ncbi:MAG: fibronectin type III domain-containing protein, partial [Nocardioidaceae bacterium]